MKRVYSIPFGLLLLSLATSCSNKKETQIINQTTPEQPKASNIVPQESSDTPSEFPIIGSAITKSILKNTNKKKTINKNKSNTTEDATTSDSISFNKDLYLSTLKKIANKREEFRKNEILQKFALKTANYSTDALFDFASVATKNKSSIITNPLKGIRNDMVSAAIEAKIENHNIQIANMIGTIARGGSSELGKAVMEFRGTSEEINSLRLKLEKEASTVLNGNDAQNFISELRDEYMASAITYAAQNLKQLGMSARATETDLKAISKKLSETRKSLNSLSKNLEEFATNNNAYMLHQKYVLSKINDKLNNTGAGIQTSIVKLDFLAQMTFGNLPARSQLQLLKNSPEQVPLSIDERRVLMRALEFKVTAEDALTSISSFQIIGSNLGLLGRDGERSINIASTLIGSAMAFASGGPVGYLQGAATLSTLFIKNKRSNTQAPDPRIDAILKNQQITFNALEKIQENIFELKEEISKGFQSVKEEIYISRNISVESNHSVWLRACKTLSEITPATLSYDELLAALKETGGQRILDICLDDLSSLFNRNFALETQLTYIANFPVINSRLYANYTNIYNYLDGDLTKGIGQDALNPEVIYRYVTMLLNNHFWFDLTGETNNNARVLVTKNKLANNILHNKTSKRLLNNALALVEKAIFQHRMWSGLVGLEEYYQKYSEMSAAEIPDCEIDRTNVLCLASNNPYFFANLATMIVRKEITPEYYYGAIHIAPNDPDHMNAKLKGPLKLVWIGEGADRTYQGTVIRDDALEHLYGPGVYFALKTKQKTVYYPMPSKDSILKGLAVEMPKTEILLNLRKIIQDELIELDSHKILNKEEHQQMVNAI